MDTTGLLKTFHIFFMILRFYFTIINVFVPSYLISDKIYGFLSLDVPLFPSSQEVNITLLDQMYWGVLPIDKLWYHLQEDVEVRSLLVHHCTQLTYDQILWVAQNDPLTKGKLLIQNEECMSQIMDWSRVTVEAYKNDFIHLSLSVFSSDDLIHLPTEIIQEGLRRINYKFENTHQHCAFLKKFSKLTPIPFSQLKIDLFSFNLFNANCNWNGIKPFNDEDVDPQVPMSKLYPQFFLKLADFVLCQNRFHFFTNSQNPEIYAALQSWRIVVSELKDLLEHIEPYANTKTLTNIHASYYSISLYHKNMLLDKCNNILYPSKAAVLPLSPSEIVQVALQNRDIVFFTDPTLISTYGQALEHMTGWFDQWRLLSIFIPRLSTNIEPESGSIDIQTAFLKLFYDLDIISASSLRSYLQYNPHDAEKLYELQFKSFEIFKALSIKDTRKIQNRSSLNNVLSMFTTRISSCLPYFNSSSKLHKKFIVLRTDSPLPYNSLVSLSNRIITNKRLFSHPKFSIKISDDVVIDMGGPLLDWISGFIQNLIIAKLFNFPEPDNIDGYAVDDAESNINIDDQSIYPSAFIDTHWFTLLGLLHGKLLQLGSIPSEKLRFDHLQCTIFVYLRSLLQMDNEREAVRIFNDYGFVNIEWISFLYDKRKLFNYHSHVVAINRTDILKYQSDLEAIFKVWSQSAAKEYYSSVKLFLNDSISNIVLNRILTPAASVISPMDLVRISTIVQADKTIKDPSHIWSQVLSNLSNRDLQRILLFSTGQRSLMFNSFRLELHFVVESTRQRRLPLASTCFKQLFIFIPQHLLENNYDEDHTLLTNYIKDSLLLAIYNCNGFGNI